MEKTIVPKAEITSEERALIMGDLRALSPEQRSSLYFKVCDSLGLNPLTQPFQYLELNGKLVLYAARNCTDQLRSIHNVSLKITARERIGDIFSVSAQATKADGRVDESIGAVTIGHLKGDALANALMKAECVPIDYDILTANGFKSPMELIDGELVAAVDPETMETKWVPLISKSIFTGQVVEKYMNSAIEFEITNGHKWIVEKQNGNRELVEFDKINSGHKIMMAGNPMNENGLLDLSPKQAAALGWIVTDGTIKKYKGKNYRASVCQSKQINFEHIDWALSDMSPTKSITDNHGKWMDQHWWHLSVDQTQKLFGLAGFESRDDLPRIASQLAPESRRSMLNAMMRADGDNRNIFAKTDRRIIECAQILMALDGKMTSMIRERWMEKSTKPIFTVRQMSYNHINKQNLELVEKRATTVWCPTTKFGTWICRTNKGQVFVTGNTKAKRRVTLSICGLSFLDETELETVRDARQVPMDAPAIAPSPAITGFSGDQGANTAPAPQATNHGPDNAFDDGPPWANEPEPPPMPPAQRPVKNHAPQNVGGDWQSYVCRFGKFTGKTLEQIGINQGVKYVEWLEKTNRESGKQMSDSAAEFIQMFRAYYQSNVDPVPVNAPPSVDLSEEIPF